MALLSIALEPKTAADAQKLARALEQLTAEDGGLRVVSDQSSGKVLIAGMHEHHLEIVIDRLKREFNVEAGVGRPQVLYKEALTRAAEGEMKYARRAGGRGEYAHVKLRVHPGERGSGCLVEPHVVGGAIPKEFIGSVVQGVNEALAHGVLAGYPLDDVRVEVYDGSYHDVDSSEAAFSVAGALAAQDATRKAQPVLLEPVMRVEVSIPSECLDDVTRNIAGRRGRIQLRQDCADAQVVLALVPLADLFGYATDLQSRTRGRGTCTIEFHEYEPIRPETDGGDRGSCVGVPLEPRPKRWQPGVALPEPDEPEVGA